MRIMRPHLRAWLAASAVIVLLVIGYRGVRSLTAPDPDAVMRDSILALRAMADSCRAEVDSGVASMLAFNETLDSMRARVRDLEALDRRGVPIDSYDVYLDAFNAYNDSAGGWAEREDTVRDLDARCRGIAEHHNLLADSMRRAIIARQRRR
jgi:hypothetical protein